MNIETLTVGDFQSNCFLVIGDKQEAIVIDPGGDASAIAEALKANDLTPVLYLLTHGHVDHVSAVAELHETMPADVAIHEADLSWAFTPDNAMLPFYPQPAKPSTLEPVMHDKDKYTYAGLTFSVIATPGHTPGSVCLYFETEKVLFTGDTLFSGSIGRTDLPGGDMVHMKASLATLSQMPDDITIYAGHGPSSTIGFEKQHNAFLTSMENVL
jgi:hydroxyacylglutathione hydrolase